MYVDQNGTKVYSVAVVGLEHAKQTAMWGTFGGLEHAKQAAMWGTFGKGGLEHCGGRGCPKHPLVWKRLIDCETDHLLKILENQRQVYYNDYHIIIKSILKDRGVKCS